MKKRDSKDFLQDILNSVNDIEDFVGSMSFEQFAVDKKTVNAVVRSIEIIGEATKNISDSLKEKHKELPWKKMAGMRDRLIHDYVGVDTEILWKAVKENIPPLKRSIEKILKDLEKR